jgi:hypothetical protein
LYVLGTGTLELHLEHFLAMTLVEFFEKVALNAVPHILASLLTMAPARFKYTSFLVGAVLFETGWHFVPMAILMLLSCVWL